MLYATPWQTVGPYLAIGMTWLNTADLAGDNAAGTRIAIAGVLVDGNGQPIADGQIELWQADAQGRYPEDRRRLPPDAGFRGFGRVPTDGEGRFSFRTVRPGRVPAADGRLQAPHINVSVFARGILKRLLTRIYFPDEAANADDPLLARVPVARRPTLIAREDGAGAYTFNIVVQGEALGQGETVFFDF
jgi:protocatechuate 3,4-dioxygenase alpha subunit